MGGEKNSFEFFHRPFSDYRVDKQLAAELIIFSCKARNS